VDSAGDAAAAEGLGKAAGRSTAAGAAQLSGAAANQASQVQGPTAAWLQKLHAGEVTREQAVEGLVAQAIESHGGARLSHAYRQELEAVLRAALLDDPVLGGLLRQA
jgi:hypothetical protein